MLSAYFAYLPFPVLDAGYQPTSTFSAFTGDLNGDGHQDLIVPGAIYPWGGQQTAIPQPGRVLFGDGAGAFSNANSSQFPVASLLTIHPRKILVADFNGDGKGDIYVSSHGWDESPFPGEQNRLYLSDGSGGWIDATSNLPALSDYSHTSTAIDFDHDGDVDVVVGNGYGGQNNILSYILVNDGTGHFALDRSPLPTGSGQVMDFLSGHMFPGLTSADLNGDLYPELIVTADASNAWNKNIQTTILWNNHGVFDASTPLPAEARLAGHIDLDVKPIELNGDDQIDLVVVGTQGQPFYDGWFVQLLVNTGNFQYIDATASLLSTADSLAGQYGAASGTSWAMWVEVIDFNHDGYDDFAVEYNGAQITQSTPLVWINDGAGHFHTLKVSDFVEPGQEWRIGGGHLYPSDHGYSFVTVQTYAGLIVTGVAQTSPYYETAASVGDAHLYGGDGADDLKALAGNDTLSGGNGNDVLDGGPGRDALEGGSGSDTASYLNAASRVIASAGNGTGVDWRVADGSWIDSGHSEILSAIENIDGGARDDALYGGSGANVLSGNGGSDHLYGLAGDDSLDGGSGKDYVEGGNGNDTLAGGTGNDVLIGGFGADQFRFDTLANASTNLDTVVDFQSGKDHIQLENSVFTAFTATGALPAGSLVSGAGVTAAIDGNDFLLYDSSAGALYYDPDGNGASPATQFAMLKGHPAIVAADFLVT